MCPTGMLHTVPNDETLYVKEGMKLHEKPVKKNGMVVPSMNMISAYVEKQRARVVVFPPPQSA